MDARCTAQLETSMRHCGGNREQLLSALICGTTCARRAPWPGQRDGERLLIGRNVKTRFDALLVNVHEFSPLEQDRAKERRFPSIPFFLRSLQTRNDTHSTSRTRPESIARVSQNATKVWPRSAGHSTLNCCWENATSARALRDDGKHR